jgi:hypothetical protein
LPSIPLLFFGILFVLYDIEEENSVNINEKRNLLNQRKIDNVKFWEEVAKRKEEYVKSYELESSKFSSRKFSK